MYQMTTKIARCSIYRQE